MENEIIKSEGLATIKDFMSQSENQIITISNPEEVKRLITAIAEKHKEMIVTKDNLDEARKGRRELLTTRTSLEKLSAHNTKIFNAAKDASKQQINDLIAITEPVEEEIDKQIKVIEQEKQRLKDEEDRKERERVEKIETTIQKYRKELSESYLKIKAGDAELPEFIAMLEALKKEDMQEFQFEGEQLYYEYESKTAELRELIEKKKEEAKQLADFKLKQEQDKQKEKAEKAAMDKRFETRKKQVLELGIKYQGGDFIGDGISFYNEQVYSPTDEKWAEMFKWIKDTVERKAKDKEDREKLDKEKQEFEKQKKEQEKKALKLEFGNRKIQLINLGFRDDEDEEFMEAPYLTLYYTRIMNSKPADFEDVMKQIVDLKQSYEEKIKAEQDKEQRVKARMEEVQKMGFNSKLEHPSGVVLNKVDLSDPDEKEWKKSVKTIKELIKTAEEKKKQAELADKDKQAQIKEMQREGKDVLYFLDVCISKMISETPKFKNKTVASEVEKFYENTRVGMTELKQKFNLK